ncbi:hypothetical protein RUM44_001418 [Polyplax serrata]|uniref:Uncharacterized protein n=1 Tax=Polyplax serrata TaxID=468196 RepID=A0ABR1AJZ5_POLSC
MELMPKGEIRKLPKLVLLEDYRGTEKRKTSEMSGDHHFHCQTVSGLLRKRASEEQKEGATLGGTQEEEKKNHPTRKR